MSISVNIMLDFSKEAPTLTCHLAYIHAKHILIHINTCINTYINKCYFENINAVKYVTLEGGMGPEKV